MASVSGPAYPMYGGGGGGAAAAGHPEKPAGGGGSSSTDAMDSALAGLPQWPDYKDHTDKAAEFLMNYSQLGDYDAQGRKAYKYRAALGRIADRIPGTDGRVLRVDLDDVEAHLQDAPGAAASGEATWFMRMATQNAARYVKIFEEAADLIFAEKQVRPTRDLTDSEDAYDVLSRQRAALVAQLKAKDQADGESFEKENPIPPTLTRRFEVRLIPPSMDKAIPVREIRAPLIGHLVRSKGIVVRVTDIKPLCEVATYTCDSCGIEVYQEVGHKQQFMPLFKCPSRDCKLNKKLGDLYPQTRGSKFVKYQEVKLQEQPNDVPAGHVPRCITVQCRGELCRSTSPGDIVTVTGIYLPRALGGGFRARSGSSTAASGAALMDTYIEAQSILKHKKSYEEVAENANDKYDAMINKALAGEEDCYTRLAKSIAPEVWGHADVKKALLLQLVGGVTRKLPDGMKIRGDVNVCLMGDPGVAKSQLLKYISSIAPRGVYTTGKGSSGVGLTAAVVVDPVTNERSLEGGSLVIADKGICCIDEFDKMDEYDRTAIHEVMEQQTVSIAKAGITTTLNARTSVLAAANPLYSRWNKRKSMSDNINLPNSLISRFDLIFLILDTPSEENDLKLAKHVCHVHTHACPPTLDFEPYDPAFLKYYIAQAREHDDPVVPEALTEYIVTQYVSMRSQQANLAANDQTVMTARQLLSILRLAQSLARLRFAEEVDSNDIDEAIRLIHVSKASLADDEDGPGGAGGANASGDAVTRVYRCIRDYAAAAGVMSLEYAFVADMVTKKGFTAVDLQRCIDEYTELNVIQVDQEMTKIDFVE